MRVTLQEAKRSGDRSDTILTLDSVEYYTAASATKGLRHFLGAAKLVWPAEMGGVYLTDLEDLPKP